MDNQHRQISGYRELTQAEIDAINIVKSMGAALEALIDDTGKELRKAEVAALSMPSEAGEIERARIAKAQPQRWLALARTDLQTGLMYLTRAIAQPQGF